MSRESVCSLGQGLAPQAQFVLLVSNLGPEFSCLRRIPDLRIQTQYMVEVHLQ